MRTREPPLAGVNLRLSFVRAYALLNPVATQLAYLISGNSADQGLSFLQLFQGACLAGAAMLSLRARPSVAPAAKTALGLFVLVVFACAIFLLKKIGWGGPDPGGVSFDLVWYSKIVAGPFWWWVVASVIRRREDAERLLRSIFIGALLSAIVAIGCFVTGVGAIEAYKYEGVMASVGAAGVSSKQTVAFLAPLAFVSAYLGRVRHPWLGTLGVLLLLGASLLTYDRSVQAGLAVAFTWLILWRALAARDAASGLSTRLFVLAAVFAIALFWLVGFDTLSTRWSYDFDKGMIGSGRPDFYLAAWQWFKHLKIADVLFGIGMADVTRVMYHVVGRQVHTHSDLFDMLLGGGVLGIVLYGCVWLAVFRNFRGVSRRTIHFAIMGAYVAVVGTMSVITGLLAAPYAMFCLGATLQCIRVLALEPDAAAAAGFQADRALSCSTVASHGAQS